MLADVALLSPVFFLPLAGSAFLNCDQSRASTAGSNTRHSDASWSGGDSAFSPMPRRARRALLLGDGDGRFLARFAARSEALIDYVDVSARMLELARERVGAARIALSPSRRAYAAAPAGEYDLIVTHFFLDCFDERDLECLIARSGAPRNPALWIVSEFRQPRWAARC